MTYAIGGEAEYYQPKDPGPECLWCDGGGHVDICSITDVGGEERSLKDYFVDVECPRCREHPGVEPVAEREDR